MKHFLDVMTSRLILLEVPWWRQHPDMTVAVDWDIKHQFKQTIYSRMLLGVITS